MKFSTSLKQFAALALFSAFLAAPTFAQTSSAPGADTNAEPRAPAPQQCPCYEAQMPPCFQGGPGRTEDWGPGHYRGPHGGGRGYGRHHGPRGGYDGMGPQGRRGGAYGQPLLSPEEHAKMRDKMFAVKTYDECVAVQTEYRGMIELRAKEKGIDLPVPRQSRCDVLKARGVFQ